MVDMVRIDYDEEFDILYLRKENEKVSFSIKLGKNILIDVTRFNKIVGIEIFNASKALKLSIEELKNIKVANFHTIDRPNMYGVSYMIAVGKSQIESEFSVSPNPIPIQLYK
jgi:uncharacterized protein YuzE